MTTKTIRTENKTVMNRDRERERGRGRRVCFQLANRPDFVATIDSAKQWMDSTSTGDANGPESRGAQETGDANPCKWLSFIAYILGVASKCSLSKQQDFIPNNKTSDG